ncbi:histidine kinase [Nonomuraea sp. NPDC049480]|uniref:sensor histidine kinase n=1 Tax=Nonomuraea sp. NPDC049480 TaxID=3364353 RepID=UPI003798707E
MRTTALLRRLTTIDPRIVDAALAVAFTLINVVWALSGDPRQAVRPPDTWSLLLTAAANLPLAFRRRWPLAVLAACCTAALTYHLLGYDPDQNVLGSLLALYSVAAHRPLSVCLAGSALTVLAWAYASAAQDPAATWWAALIRALVVCGFMVAFGLIARLLAQRHRRQAELTARLRELTRRLRQERDSTARLAAAGERVRIARELHDVVAHHVSVISVQAELGQYVLTSDPATAATALATIADTSRQALEEMQRLLSILRIGVEDSPPAYDATPGLGGLAALIERVRTAGVTVELTEIGEPRPLPPGLELCLYRIVQEGLTNILKHAAPTRAQLTLEYAPDAVTVQITDDGPSDSLAKRRQPSKVTQTTPGYGLLGMTERVKLYRGTITAAPCPTGGFRVAARVPLPVHPGEQPTPAIGNDDHSVGR